MAQGFTLVQLLAAQAVLFTLSLVLPAWVAVSVNHARVARAERDVAAIADAIQRFERDNGFPPAWTRAAGGGPGSEADRVDLLVGPGAMPQIADEAGSGWRSARTDSLEHQLIDNAPGYVRPRPALDRGWRGPYLRPPTEDPWGNRYLVSLGFAPTDRAAIGGAGDRGHPWILSAGPNGIVETPYPPVDRAPRSGGDDVIVVGPASWPIGVSSSEPGMDAAGRHPVFFSTLRARDIASSRPARERELCDKEGETR